MNDALRPVLDALPEAGKMIRRQYAKDSVFRLLCRDYADALAAVHIWQRSIKTEAPQRVTEYQVLVGELRRDIEKYLEKVQ